MANLTKHTLTNRMANPDKSRVEHHNTLNDEESVNDRHVFTLNNNLSIPRNSNSTNTQVTSSTKQTQGLIEKGLHKSIERRCGVRLISATKDDFWNKVTELNEDVRLSPDEW